MWDQIQKHSHLVLGKLEIHQPYLTARKTEQRRNPSMPMFWQCYPPIWMKLHLFIDWCFVKLLWVFKWTAVNGVFSFPLRLKISWSTRSGAGRTARSWSECTSWKVRASSGLSLQQGLCSQLSLWITLWWELFIKVYLLHFSTSTVSVVVCILNLYSNRPICGSEGILSGVFVCYCILFLSIMVII